MKYNFSKTTYLYLTLTLGLIFILSIGLALYFYHFQNKKSHESFQPIISIHVARAALTPMPITRYASGTVKSLATANVRALVGGELKKIYFNEGKMVKQGEILAEIDDRPYSLALNKAHGQWISNQAQLNQAQADLKRFKLLLQQDSLTQQDYDKQVALTAERKGALATSYAQYEQAKLDWQHTRIAAPISGRAGIQQIELGNYMQLSESQSLVSIVQLNPISIIFTLPETDLPLLKRRLHEQADLIVNAYDRNQSQPIAIGKVVAIDNQIDDATGTIKLRANFDNKQNGLFPNQFVKINLQIDKITDAIVIPSAAIQSGEKGQYVYLISENNTVSIRYVVTSFSNGEQTIIKEGLKMGDLVAMNGIDRLSENTRVRPIELKP